MRRGCERGEMPAVRQVPSLRQTMRRCSLRQWLCGQWRHAPSSPDGSDKSLSRDCAVAGMPLPLIRLRSGTLL